MKTSAPFIQTTAQVGDSRRPSLWRGGFVLVALGLSFGLLPPAARAVTPAPDGGYANGNTAEGTDALFSLNGGFSNTAIGFQALFSNTTGNYNTALGDDALVFNTTGDVNTAVGFEALLSNITGGSNTALGYKALSGNTNGISNTAVGLEALSSNTTGNYNTAMGLSALLFNTTGSDNTAVGLNALFSNTTGFSNTATGYQALVDNTTGFYNTATGFEALFNNTTGIDNTANGHQALMSNTTGNSNTAMGFQTLLAGTTSSSNTAIGFSALLNATGSSNIALGESAGINLTTGKNNIDLGNKGVAGESNAIRIGKKVTQKNTYIAGISGTTVAGGVGVMIDTDGHLGTLTSSARYKEAIKPMDEASEAILALRPVTFRYQHELDPKGIPQFGLVAEQVEKVNPALVARDDQGKPYTVRYEAVNAMLLNEFLKEHRKVEEQGATISKLESTVAQQQEEFRATAEQQQKEITALTVALTAHAAQFQQVSTQLDMSGTRRVVATNP